jgi:hypothetical protein
VGDQINDNELDQACGTCGGEEKCIPAFGWETEGKRHLGRLRYKWEDNVKVCLKKIGWKGMGYVNLAQDRDKCWAPVDMVMTIWVP